MRTALSQFGWWATPEDAARYLATAPKTADNYGDRVAAERRASSLPGYELPSSLPTAEQWAKQFPARPRSATPVPRSRR